MKSAPKIFGHFKKIKGLLSRKAMIIFGLVVLILLVSGFVAYVLFYTNRVLPHIYTTNYSVSGLTKTEAQAKIDTQIQKVVGSSIKLTVADQTLEIHAADVGLTYNSAETVSNVYIYGRRDNFWRSMLEFLAQIFFRRTVKYTISFDNEKLAKLVSDFAEKVDQAEVNAGIKVEDSEVVETTGSTGYKLDQDAAIAKIVSRWQNGETESIKLSRTTIAPLFLSGHTEEAIAQAKKLRQAKIKLSDGTTNYSPTNKELDSWISSAMVNSQIQASVSKDAIKTWLKKISTSINQDPTESRLSLQNGVVSIASAGKDGRELDVDKTADNIISAVQGYVTSDSSSGTIAVSAVINVTKPQVTENNISNLGVSELIGTAMTNFSGSPTNRIHNITVGAAALNGILIAPGEEFSTLKYLGKINSASGYLPELVIKENKTEPEYGGGLCQVSTTLFRAAMQSGLKITERRNHSYRVSYYEPPVGMDATIYEGSPDFKFVNDTGSYILIQSKVVGTKITFDFYGKSDGRTVEISTPTVYDIVQPADPEYVNTDTLPTGTTKQTEKAHAGSNASFSYVVYNSDKTVRTKQTFTSHYVPWRARYLVGTGPAASATP